MTLDDVQSATSIARTVIHTANPKYAPIRHPDARAAVDRLRHPWRGPAGENTVHPLCSRTGSPAPLARIVDPIDQLDPHHDPVHLMTAMRNVDHAARVLALAIRHCR